MGGGYPESAFTGRVPPASVNTGPGWPAAPASTPQPLSAAQTRSSTVLQSSPGGSRGATNPKTWPRDAPSALWASHWPTAVVTPSLPRLPLTGMLGCVCRWLGPRRGFAAGRARVGSWAQGSGRGRGARGPGSPRTLRPAHAGRGPGAGPGAAAGAEGGRGGPARPAAPCPASPRARATRRDALCRPAPPSCLCPEAESSGARDRPPPPAPMTAQGLLLPSQGCALPSLPRS